ncbi:MAG: glycoside hydrolase [Acidobacteriota bacterium]|nr:glycoside hydrolase [Acidobacteriota bacterium]
MSSTSVHMSVDAARKSACATSFIAIFCAAAAYAQPFPPKLFGEMQWRSIGPYRGGRTKAVAGVPSQPNLFYIGAVNGGIWKTNDYGRTWNPIFDREDTGSIGAIAVAPSNPSVIYVGSGEGLQRPDLSTGDGIYKSVDAGKTWIHLGLRDGQQIPGIAIDSGNPDRLFVAVLGHPYGPNPERGVFRSTDGGRTFEKVLYKDENTGASFVAIDPSNPQVVYAALWEARQAPWENGAWSGTGGGIFKSIDGGTTWNQLSKGLPTGADGVIQAYLAISPSNPNRLYATASSKAGVGIYRSNDAGESWAKTTNDPRPAAKIGGGDVPVPGVDPQDPDTLYITSTVTWKSTDAGKSWTALRGAPGGDDYQNIWINPNRPEIILLASDQGAIVSVNGGETWSSWYNQPTAQMYHAAAGNAFPYRVCGGQQESGSACVSSRGNDGEITFRDWHPVAAEEYGYVAPDPLNPDIVYGGKLTRYDRRTGQAENILPKPLRGAGFRVLRTAPVVFSPVDPRLLFFGANTLWRTRDGGQNWREISPDLSRKAWQVPANAGKYRDSSASQPTRRGVIYAVAPSPLDVNRIWAGTDDGLIHLTTDGGRHWRDVTPAQLVPFAKVSIIDAGHFDRATAYAAINTLRLDDMRPHILRTHDGGKTWDQIVNGIPDGAPTNVVREDPKRKGLLYAGTEREVYVSFDDGDHWQALRLNMPATSIRDLAIKDEDLIAGTHGRGFWILDDVTPLRQITAQMEQSAAFLFRPETALRVRWNTNTDTPLPPDEPAGQNPPDGAILDYFLRSESAGEVTIEILDRAGRLVHGFSSNEAVETLDSMLPIPAYWPRPQQRISREPGMHRIVWDLHLPPIGRGLPREYPIAAVYRNTPPAPTSPWVLPGQYKVRLTVDGKQYTQPLTVRMDPRVKTPVSGLIAQFDLSNQIYRDILNANDGLEQILRAIAAGREDRSKTGDAIVAITRQLAALLQIVQEADAAPTPQAVAAARDRHAALGILLQQK